MCPYRNCCKLLSIRRWHRLQDIINIKRRWRRSWRLSLTPSSSFRSASTCCTLGGDTADTHGATSSVCKANPGRHHHRGEGGAEEDFYKTCFSEFSPGCQFFFTRRPNFSKANGQHINSFWLEMEKVKPGDIVLCWIRHWETFLSVLSDHDGNQDLEDYDDDDDAGDIIGWDIGWETLLVLSEYTFASCCKPSNTSSNTHCGAWDMRWARRFVLCCLQNISHVPLTDL